MQSNRLFETVYLLLDKQKITAKELAEHFGVSRQTIMRDINTLSVAGIPIYTERGKGGGIRLLPDFVLNKSILSKQEQNEILSALHGVSQLGLSGAENILQKLSTIFHTPMPNWLEIDFSDWSRNENFFNGLKTAIINRKMVSFDYYNRYGEKSFRRVEPMQLCFKSKSWYLKGFCRKKQGIRLYKLLRIKNLVMTDEYFDARDFTEISDNPLDHWGKQPELALTLHIAPQMAYRVYDDFIENEVERQADGSFIVTASFSEDHWLYGFLLSYGKYVEVLAPEHMRNTMREKTQEMLEIYL